MYSCFDLCRFCVADEVCVHGALLPCGHLAVVVVIHCITVHCVIVHCQLLCIVKYCTFSIIVHQHRNDMSAMAAVTACIKASHGPKLKLLCEVELSAATHHSLLIPQAFCTKLSAVNTLM